MCKANLNRIAGSFIRYITAISSFWICFFNHPTASKDAFFSMIIYIQLDADQSRSVSIRPEIMLKAMATENMY